MSQGIKMLDPTMSLAKVPAASVTALAGQNHRTNIDNTWKYCPLRWDLKQQYPGYSVKQCNIIDALGVNLARLTYF